MVYTRTMQINNICKFTYPYFKQALAGCASMGALNFYIHEKKNLFTTDIAVDIWSENQGSVSAICDQFLKSVAMDPSLSGISDAAQRYNFNVSEWLRQERYPRL